MECTQDLHHQQQLEQQEQEEQSIIRISKNHHGNEMRTHIWGSDETVFLNIDSGICHQSFFLTKDQALLLAQDLLKARAQA
jgi:hypothetical protein